MAAAVLKVTLNESRIELFSFFFYRPQEEYVIRKRKRENDGQEVKWKVHNAIPHISQVDTARRVIRVIIVDYSLPVQESFSDGFSSSVETGKRQLPPGRSKQSTRYLTEPSSPLEFVEGKNNDTPPKCGSMFNGSFNHTVC